LVGANSEVIPEDTLKTIETEVVEFLRQNKSILTCYFLSGQSLMN
jgi:hypothetical protein